MVFWTSRFDLLSGDDAEPALDDLNMPATAETERRDIVLSLSLLLESREIRSATTEQIKKQA